MRYILAHDLGTSGNKATLFSEDGRLIKSEVFSYDAHYFNDTWVEQNADDWWNAVCRTSSSLIQSTGVDPREIGAISFSGQMMGCLCVDRNGILPYRRTPKYGILRNPEINVGAGQRA